MLNMLHGNSSKWMHGIAYVLNSSFGGSLFTSLFGECPCEKIETGTMHIVKENS